MLILEDTRQQEGKHENKHKYFRENGIYWNRTALYCGDYTLPTNQSVCVDTKKDMQEIIGDIQVKTITKKDLELEIEKIFVKYNLCGVLPSEILSIIWQDDTDRFPEKEINEICFKNSVPESAIADFQKLYVKRRGFFHRGLKRAQNSGIKLYVLIENTDGIKNVQDVFKWQNPRMERYNRIAFMHRKGKWLGTPLPKGKPTSGSTLAKAMLTMQLKYGVEFVFCRPEDAGKKVIELLGGNADGGCEMD